MKCTKKLELDAKVRAKKEPEAIEARAYIRARTQLELDLIR